MGAGAEAQRTGAQAEIADAASVDVGSLRDPQADTERAVQPEVRFRAPTHRRTRGPWSCWIWGSVASAASQCDPFERHHPVGPVGDQTSETLGARASTAGRLAVAWRIDI